MELAKLFTDVAADIAADIATEIFMEVLAEVVSGERVGVIDACWHYRRVLAWFLTWQICKVADGVRIVYSREHAGVIGVLLTGLNSFGGVIIVTDASRFERVEDRKCTGVISVLLDMVFNIAKPLRLWQSVKNVGIAC